MLAASSVVAFVPTADLGRSRPFYEEVLGLTVVHADDFACVFDACGTMLRLTPAGGFRPQPFTILGWDVPDIVAEVTALAARGVEFRRYDGLPQDDLGIWDSPSGARIAWYADPDDNTLSLTQF